MKSWFPLIPVLATAASCTAASSQSHPVDADTESESGTDTGSETDTGTGFPGASVILPTEDLLPDWAMDWVKATGGTGGDFALGIAVSGPDTFVAAGFMLDSGISEIIPFEGIMIPGGGSGNMFLVKYDIDGKILWVTWAGDEARALAWSVDSLDNGKLAVAGFCGDNALFGPGEPTETLVSAGNYPYETSFVASYEADGTLAWVRTLLLNDLALQESRSEGFAVRVMEDGSVVATGQFDGEVVAGAGTPTETTLVRDPEGEQFAYNAFIVKYDEEGNLLWARREGGPGKTVGTGLAVLPDGSFYLAGGFEGTAVFGDGQTNETELVSMGDESAFLARFDSEANLEWVTDLGVIGELPMYHKNGGLLLLSNGDVAMPGVFIGSMLAGDGDDVTPVASETWGLFLARYDAGGERVWTRVAPGNGKNSHQPWRQGIVEANDGTLVVASATSGTMTFGAGQTNEAVLQNTLGSQAAILYTYSGSGEFLWVLPQHSADEAVLHDVVRFSGEDPETDILIAGGGFSDTVTFGTGGDDVVTLTATEPSPITDFPHDIVLLRFDREGP